MKGHFRFGGCMAKKVRKTRNTEEDALKIEAIPSTDPAARDEGPRLLPLRPNKDDSLAGKKYLDLADRALHGPHTKK